MLGWINCKKVFNSLWTLSPAYVKLMYQFSPADVPKEDGYPDVQAFMAAYREIESVAERCEREALEYNLKLKQKEKPAKKPPEKQNVR